jgi:predicted metal-dependent enzyme (double-stranded beta helix superfamily)
MRAETDSWSSTDDLVLAMETAVRLGDVSRITGRIKRSLEDLCGSGLRLPSRFREPDPGCYARRLLHRDLDLGYTVVVMTWGPGQGTGLHDHAGMWCVECVVEGSLEVTQYDLLDSDGERCRFEKRNRVRAGVGDAGCLIPPYEYHVLSNALREATSITVHVYGGEMDHCHLYTPDSDGWWTRDRKRLAYNP